MVMKGYSILPGLQKKSLIIRCNLLSYTGHLFLGVGASCLSAEDTVNIFQALPIGLKKRFLFIDRVIPKTQKMVLDAYLLNTQHYKVWIKSKRSNQRKGVARSPTHRCSSYVKGSLQVALDNSLPTYLTYY